MVRAQHKPHHPGTPLSHTGTLGSGEGDHSSPIVLSGVVGRPLVLLLYGTSKTLFCFGRPSDPLGALAAAAVPKAPVALDDHIFAVWAPNLSSNHSIGIYCQSMKS